MAKVLAKEIQRRLVEIDTAPTEEFEHTQASIYETLTSYCKKDPSGKNLVEPAIELILENYLQTNSERVFKILVKSPLMLDEVLITILGNRLRSQNELKRQTILLFYLNVVHAQPSWLPKLVNQETVALLMAIIRDTPDVVLVARAALVLLELIAALPSVITQCLEPLFETFSRLCWFIYLRVYNDEHRVDLNYLHLNSIVYRLFVRLYGMFPGNFVSYLASVYGPNADPKRARCFSTENVFHRVIEPMLALVKFHPQLIIGTRDDECAHFRAIGYESHEIVSEVGQLSLDCAEFVPDDAEGVAAACLGHRLSNGDIFRSLCSPGYVEGGNKEEEVEEEVEEFFEEDDSIEEIDYRVVRHRDSSLSTSMPTSLPIPMAAMAVDSGIVKPRAISSKPQELMIGGREKLKVDEPKKSIGGSISPFKPIETSESTDTTNDQDEEMMAIYQSNLDRKAEMERTKRELREWQLKAKQFSPEFIIKMKNSLREANKRIRYQSTCLPETEKLDELLGVSPSSVSSSQTRSTIGDEDAPNLVRLRVASKSCPILFFECKEEELWGAFRPMRQRHVSAAPKESASATPAPISGGKSKVKVMLRNPNTELGNSRRAMQQARFKAVKSVDCSREVAPLSHGRTLAMLLTCRQHRQHSGDSNSTAPVQSSKSKTPHELLANMLELNTELYFKEDGDGGNISRAEIRRAPLAYSGKGKEKMLIMGEADMRRQLALLYTQLIFERHQRDLHVVRNRRLYKQTKQAEEAQEMYRVAQEQLRLQEVDIEKMQRALEAKLLDFEEASLGMQTTILDLRAQLAEAKAARHRIQTEKDALEARLSAEIESLNLASGMFQRELAATFEAPDKEDQLKRLKEENADLKDKLLLFGEFHEKLKMTYNKQRSLGHEEVGRQLEFEALNAENDELNEKVRFMMAQMEALQDELAKRKETEEAVTEVEEATEAMDETEVVEYVEPGQGPSLPIITKQRKNSKEEAAALEKRILEECLKAKDEQLDAYKAVIISLEKHIQNVYGNAECDESKGGNTFKPIEKLLEYRVTT